MQTIERGDVKRKDIEPGIVSQAVELLSSASTIRSKCEISRNEREVALFEEVEQLTYQKLKDELVKNANSVLNKHAIVEPVKQVAQILTGMIMTPDEVFDDIRIYNKDGSDLHDGIDGWDGGGLEFLIRARVVVGINCIRRSEDGCNTTTFTGSQVYENLVIHPESNLHKIYSAWNTARLDLIDTRSILSRWKTELDKVENWKDLARVKLNRMELEQLGANGKKALDVVDTLLENPDVEYHAYVTVDQKDG